MAKFFILYSTKKNGDVADFFVDFLDSHLEIGDEFVTYDTHHKQKWKVLNIKAVEDKFIVSCSSPTGLGFDEQFAGALLDTEGTTRLELFRYGDIREKELNNPGSYLYAQLKRIKEQNSGFS